MSVRDLPDFLKAEAAQRRAEDWDFVLNRVPARPPLPGEHAEVVAAW